MSSLLKGFEYDIFISYRQNDNHSDKWVSNFVNALKEELEATLKNPVSIYFDENPHDGLLETHQVDASLAKKLKCLVFIPIISQTYCDETSFAWEHEFLPFVEMVKKDELGMNITLSNGNVVSRVLPIKIHDLDTEDQHTLEAVLDGPLRSIDFIYQQPGVNRPLRANEDDPNNNLNKTFYRDQINKVANSLKDIGTSIIKQSDEEISEPSTKSERTPEIKPTIKGIYVGLSIIIIALLSYWGYKQFYTSSPADIEDVTLAVLAFDDQSPDGDQEWLGDGMADEILNVLAKVNGFQVTGKTSSFSFKDKDATIKEIGKALNVTTVLEGSVCKVGDKLRITAQLIDVETDKHIWSEKYDRDASNIFAIIDEVAQNIASELRNELSIEEIENIKIGNQIDPEAYEYFMKAELIHEEYTSYNIENHDSFSKAKKLFLKALDIDSNYIDVMAGLANLYDTRGNISRNNPTTRKLNFLKRDSILNIAYHINPNNSYVLYLKGFCSMNYDSAFFYLKKAYTLNPYGRGGDLLVWKYREMGLHNENIFYCKKLLSRDPLNKNLQYLLCISLNAAGYNKEYRKQVRNFLEFDEYNWWANSYLFYLKLYDKDTIDAIRISKKLDSLREDNTTSQARKSLILAVQGKKEEALSISSSLNVKLILGMKDETLLDMNQRINYLDSLGIPFTDSNLNGSLSYLGLMNKPIYDSLRQEPPFQQWLTEAKKVHDERVAKYGHLFDEE